MSFWTAVVIIVAIVAMADIRIAKLRANGEGKAHSFWPFKHHNRHRHHHDGQIADTALPSPREQELQREVEDLRERIHVLERIATDANTPRQRQSRELAAEIESLRDK